MNELARQAFSADNPRVSVIIPCFNVSEYIADAVRSVMPDNQDFVSEIICVDNGSTDNTIDILEQLKKECSLVFITHEEKKGACAARNKGIKISSGECIQFLDADDVLKKSKISHQLEFSNQNNGANVAGGFVRLATTGTETNFIPDSNQWTGLFNTRFGVTSSLLLIRQDVLAAGAWDEEMQSSQEYDLMFRMMKSGARFVSQEEALTIVRDRPHGQISQVDPPPRWSRYLRLRADIMKFLDETGDAYFTSHQTEFKQAFFDLVRTVYPHAPEVALSFYVEVLKNDFNPVVSKVSGKNYIRLHKLLGFPIADRIKKLFSGH
ncbi:MAG: glycosyltransferase family A protein [Flavobacteriales bacterium]|nr:glycosyltransferase family A protein [Flavobacteriales bacterium]